MSVDWGLRCDLLVVGGGVAGLTAALASADAGLSVLIVDRGRWTEGRRPVVRFPATATRLAQGGVAVNGLADAREPDSVELHTADTLDAGAGLCDEVAVRSILGDAGDAVHALIARGARFDRDADGRYTRTREGGHSVRRILHAGGDASGAEIQRALEEARVRRPVLQNASVRAIAVDDRGVTGAVVVDARGVGLVHAPAVLLATGGSGQLFDVTTGPEPARGDGLGLALRAGAELADLEFVQFHPTVLYDAERTGRRPLVSEAVRGEGAILLRGDGRRLMDGVDVRGDLAPRDIVARAIALYLRESGAECVHLDARGIDDFAGRFPTVTAGCAEAGIDPARDLIPVAPAAHYQCGGVITDVHGRTRVDGLFAAGEVACTGLHGANRLASNSLLEGMVVGRRIASVAAARAARRGQTEAGVPAGVLAGARWVLSATGAATPPGARDLRKAMSRGVGVTRDEESLAGARARIDAVARALDRPVDAAMLGGSVELCHLIVDSARAREETRGGHTRLDHPDPDPRWRTHLVHSSSEDGISTVRRPNLLTEEYR